MLIFGSTEFWAAIVGGLFTLAGTLTSMWMQQRLQKIEREKISISLFQEQIRHFNSIVEHIENHYNNRGEIWYEYIDNINKSYEVIGRYFDYIVFINENYRANLRNYFSNIYYISQQAKFWQDQFYMKRQKISELNEDNAIIRSKLESEMIESRQQMKDRVLELKRITLSAPNLSAVNQKAHG